MASVLGAFQRRWTHFWRKVHQALLTCHVTAAWSEGFLCHGVGGSFSAALILAAFFFLWLLLCCQCRLRGEELCLEGCFSGGLPPFGVFCWWLHCGLHCGLRMEVSSSMEVVADPRTWLMAAAHQERVPAEPEERSHSRVLRVALG